jgi:hypothetical protein
MAMNMYPVMWTRINATATFDTDGSDYRSDLIIANILQDFDIHGGLTNVQQVLFNWENIMSNALTKIMASSFSSMIYSNKLSRLPLVISFPMLLRASPRSISPQS